MTPKRIVIAATAIALLAAPCWAGGEDGPAPKGGKNAGKPAAALKSTDLSTRDIRKPIRPGAQVDDGELIDGLIPRKPLPKTPTNELAVPADTSGRVVVKFVDDVKARARDNRLTTAREDLLNRGQFRANDVLGQGMIAAEAIITGHGVTISPTITSGEELCQRIEQKAALHSGKEQPDLAGMMYLDGPQGALLAAARQLNGLEVVEFVQFEREPRIAGETEACCFPQTDECVDLPPDECIEVLGIPQGAATDCSAFSSGECPDTGQCCVGDNCFDLTADECDNIPDSSFRGVGTVCAEAGACDDPDCGVGEPCFQANTQGLPFCEDFDCCQAVCDVAPFCCDLVWDETCAFLAQLLCEDGDRCLAGPVTGSCFDAHPLPGCDDSECCSTVCAVEPFCCEAAWDGVCVSVADQLCTDPNAGPTPDFSPAQGYLKVGTYLSEEGEIPDPHVGNLPGIPGFAGEGLDLVGYEEVVAIVDDQADQDLSLSRGEGIRVAVIEWTFHLNHEDLDVTPEPDQTMVIIPGSDRLSGNHGTACLGIIGATDDGDDLYETEVGCVGIAPEVDLWFFPIASVEQGGRTIDAIANAIDQFEAGDIFSMSFGPGGGTLASEEDTWTILKVATDAGISAIMAAGNSCLNLDGSPQFDLEGGMTVVGMGTPGRPYCRLGRSNHCEECETDVGIVDVQSWGSNVFTLGGGSAFLGDDDINRSYTATFGGTSAACPQYAATVARLQQFAKAFYGIPLTPVQIRDASKGGWPQCLIPSTNNVPGAPDGQECAGDFDPDEEPNLIGNYPDMIGNLESVIVSGFFDGADPLVDVFVLRGIYVSGNDNSIRASDDSYLIVDSLFQNRPAGFSHPDVPEASRARYFAAGQTVDIAALISSFEDPNPSSISMTAEIRFPAEVGILVVELYDYNVNNWRFVAMETLTGDEATDQVFTDMTTFNAAGLVRDSDGRCVARGYTVALGASPQYRLRIDQFTAGIGSLGPGGTQ